MAELILLRDIFLVLHIIGAIVAVGAVTVTDYVHLRGLKSHRSEKKMAVVYPILSQIVMIGLFIIVISGMGLIYFKPSLLSSGIFRLKMALVGIVIINGFILQKLVAPELKKNVKQNHPKKTTARVILHSSVFGSISVVTWYSTLILAMTKKYGYSVSSFLIVYILAIIFVFSLSFFLQSRSHMNHMHEKDKKARRKSRRTR